MLVTMIKTEIVTSPLFKHDRTSM